MILSCFYGAKAHESQAVEADKNRTSGKWWGMFKGAGFGYLHVRMPLQHFIWQYFNYIDYIQYFNYIDYIQYLPAFGHEHHPQGNVPDMPHVCWFQLCTLFFCSPSSKPKNQSEKGSLYRYPFCNLTSHRSVIFVDEKFRQPCRVLCSMLYFRYLYFQPVSKACLSICCIFYFRNLGS